MEYHGKLYGKIGNKYFDTSKSTDDWDLMEKRISELESDNKYLLEALQNLVEDTEHCELDYSQIESVKLAKAAINKALK